MNGRREKRMDAREDSRMDRQKIPGQLVISDMGGWAGDAGGAPCLRPLLESLSGEEFIMTVRFGKGEGDAG